MTKKKSAKQLVADSGRKRQVGRKLDRNIERFLKETTKTK